MIHSISFYFLCSSPLSLTECLTSTEEHLCCQAVIHISFNKNRPVKNNNNNNKKSLLFPILFIYLIIFAAKQVAEKQILGVTVLYSKQVSFFFFSFLICKKKNKIFKQEI